MMRSPPPPVPQQQQPAYSNPYQPQAGPGAAGARTHVHPAYGGFLNDQTAQMGFQVGRSAVMAGQEYMEQNVRLSPKKQRQIRLVESGVADVCISTAVQSLCQRLGTQTLLECLKLLRPP